MATISPRVSGSIVTKQINGSIQTSRKYEQYTGATEVTPTESVQTLATENKNMASDITINAIPSNYVGSDVPRQDSSSLTANGKTVTAPAGFYESDATKDVADGSATTPATTITVSPTLVVSSAGLIIADVSDSESVTPTVAEGWVSSGTAGTVSVSGSKTLQLTTQAAKTVAPTESVQTAVAKNVYTTGVVKVGAISSTYVGSGITRQDSSSLTVSAYDGTTYSVADTEPYLLRQTPSGAGDMARVDKVVGATVGWNQLIDDTQYTAIASSTVTKNDHTFTVATTVQSSTFDFAFTSKVEGHRYMLCADVGASDEVNYIRVRLGTSGTYVDLTSLQTTPTRYVKFITADSVSTSVMRMVLIAANITYTISNVQLVDLTAMFGSTTAEYVYGLGADEGIAWLKSYGYFTQPYYSYSAPTLTGVKTSGRRTVGFNLWDEQTQLGYWNKGSHVQNTTTLCSLNKIPILPNTEYYIKYPTGTFFYTFYDANADYLVVDGYDANGRLKITTAGTITTPSNAYYMTFNLGTAYGTTYNNDVCINISDTDRNGDYEPYCTRTYPTDTVTLNGILKLSNGKLYAEGDEYGYDGTVTTKYGVVDMGTLTWTLAGSGRLNTTKPSDMKSVDNSTQVNAICPIYLATTGSNIPNLDKSFAIANNSTLQVNDSTYNGGDANAFKTAMSGVYLVYELATPTTSTAAAFTQYQSGSSYGTEEWLDTRSVPMPVPSSTTYNATNSGATVTAPSGWYSESASKTVPAGSVQVSEKDITATISLSVDSAGLVTATTSASDLITAEVTDGYVSGDANAPMRVSGSNTLQITVYDGSVS